MKNFTPELIAKARAAKSVEELLEIAKANNVELTQEEATIYFKQLNANGAVSDDELDVVSGGNDEESSCNDSEEEEEKEEKTSAQNHFITCACGVRLPWTYMGKACPSCQLVIPRRY